LVVRDMVLTGACQARSASHYAGKAMSDKSRTTNNLEVINDDGDD
jgi:hypothetical protein